MACCKLYRYQVQWLVKFSFNVLIQVLYLTYFFISFPNRCRQNTDLRRRIPCQPGKGVTSTNSTEWYPQALILLMWLFFLINMIDLLLICSFECDLKTLAGHLLVTRQVCQVLIFPLLSIGCYTWFMRSGRWLTKGNGTLQYCWSLKGLFQGWCANCTFLLSC